MHDLLDKDKMIAFLDARHEANAAAAEMLAAVTRHELSGVY